MQDVGVQSIRMEVVKSPKISNMFGNMFSSERLLLLLLIIASLMYLCIILIPVAGLFKASGVAGAARAFYSTENTSAIMVSLYTSAVTLVLTFLLGTPVVFFLSRQKQKLPAKILETVINMPTALPPAVAGIGLLAAFGRNGLAGSFLEGLELEIVFTPAAVILAQLFASMGFYAQVLKTGMDSIPPEIFEACYVFGAGKIQTYIKVIIPMLKKNIAAGLIMAWTRALGEFGATIMFAGNIFGKTRTVPLQIYTLMQTDMALAASLAVALFVISFAMLFIIKMWL